jgi:hypothetical protein
LNTIFTGLNRWNNFHQIALMVLIKKAIPRVLVSGKKLQWKL